MSNSIETLRDLAMKATEGPWRSLYDGHGGVSLETDDGDAFQIALLRGSNMNNAQYIAAASPDVILRLCEVAERARRLEGAFGNHRGDPDWKSIWATLDELRSALSALDKGNTL